ncbi:pyridoxamine 5'-phosphate oxidase family protein [Citricoccus nitrophenolicus]|uniref:Pyridoxamine 5'-phosphate oxidase family protein n=1 Tax=Citricoccus nitrophenolicus TaxID=863575 RepID=A0ABV0IHC4_9MICC
MTERRVGGTEGAGAQVEALTEPRCWELLRHAEIGRLAVWVEDHPEIFPVNFTVDRGALVFRTAEGTKVSAALGDAAVALETDGPDAGSGTAWSVVVKGRAQQITDSAGLMDTVRLPLLPWQGGAKGKFIRIVPTEVTGRRFPIVSPEWWRTPLQDVPRSAEE